MRTWHAFVAMSGSDTGQTFFRAHKSSSESPSPGKKSHVAIMRVGGNRCGTRGPRRKSR
jgi:hypothetical protein